MDSAFVDWIAKKHDKLSPGVKREFLLALKNEPDRMSKIIADSLEVWAKQAVLETGINLRLFGLSPMEYGGRVTEYLKRHYAKELENIQ